MSDIKCRLARTGINRRGLLVYGGTLLGLGLTFPTFRELGAANTKGHPFSRDWLKGRAKALASEKYASPRKSANGTVDSIDFDTIQQITFRRDQALLAEGGPFPVRLFHPHKYASDPVAINIVTDGVSKPIPFNASLFDYGKTGLSGKFSDMSGFAGFRVMDGSGSETDWLAFQGASYFRTAGMSGQYGASARGLAIDTAAAKAEEFPMFREFWIEEASPDDQSIVIHALLDGPSVAGAYTFVARREAGVVMDVQADLFFRRSVDRLGLAPITSMYWFGEGDRRQATDWRPEIHDSDGLAMWTGTGERIFRPLINPPSIQMNAFADHNPKGFGLVQRDRNFDHYQDDGAFYERRPSIWVEPLGDWGTGAVELLEMPTDDEIHDNIGVFWRPKNPPGPAQPLSVQYRLHWRDLQPFPSDEVAQVAATRTGRAGIPGQPRPSAGTATKFVIDFEGGPLAQFAARYDVEPVVTASRGTVLNAYVLKIAGTDRWRAVFDLDHGGGALIDMRCFLRLGDRTLSETWLYQYFPDRAGY